METPLEKQFFTRLLLDIERRELPDCGLYFTNGALQWNGKPIETLSCKLAEEGRELHAFAAAKQGAPNGIVLMVVMMLNGEAKWSQEWAVDMKRIANISFELVKRFLELTGHIKTDRQGIELMYPAYGLRVPELVVPEPNTIDPNRVKSYASTPLPDVPEDDDPQSNEGAPHPV
jgi:hypothetical protein